MKYKYGLRVVGLPVGIPMKNFGIGKSDSSIPTQDDIVRWCNEDYAVVSWFSLNSIKDFTDKGFVLVDYFGEGFD